MISFIVLKAFKLKIFVISALVFALYLKLNARIKFVKIVVRQIKIAIKPIVFEVLFKLKKGFKFYDKGHKNEQITWLIKGKMKFYVKNKKSSLIANKTAVDIGSYDFHGGKSYGAVGFDAFSPKRSEKRYS